MSKDVAVSDEGRVDQLIWRNIGRRPVREIAELAGVSPDVVLRRKSELLDEIDVLSIQEKRVKLLVEIDDVIADARDRFGRASDEFAAGLLNSAISGAKTILTELARMERQDSDAVERLNSLRVRELLSLMNSVVLSSVAEIAETYGLDEFELREIFEGRLAEEARLLEERP